MVTGYMVRYIICFWIFKVYFMQSTANHNKINKPDFTAWFVLQGIIATMHLREFAGRYPESALELYQILAREAGKTRFVSKAIGCLPYAVQYKIGELVTNKGRLRHFYLRKKEIEKNTRKLVDEHKIEQIIVLGAGLDILALRLSREFQQLRFIEIDMEESQRFKEAALSAHNIKIPDNMELLSADLREKFSSILSASRLYKPATRTLWIAEGLFMFIPEANVPAIFTQIQENCASGSYFVFTTLAPKGQGSAVAKIIQNLFLNREKTAYHWTIFPELVPDYIQKFGFKMVEQINCNLLHKNHIGDKFDINHKIGDDIHIAKM